MPDKNLHFKRTDRDIREAFLRLCISGDFERMTIRDILDEAMVSRNTFYAHYHDKYELAQQLMNEYMDSLKAVIDELFITRRQEIYSKPAAARETELLEGLQQFMDKNRQTAAALTRIRSEEVNFPDTIMKYFSQLYRENNKRFQSDTLDMEAYLYGSWIYAISMYGQKKLRSFESIGDATVSVMLYSLGIRDPETLERLKKEISACRMDEMLKSGT